MRYGRIRVNAANDCKKKIIIIIVGANLDIVAETLIYSHLRI